MSQWPLVLDKLKTDRCWTPSPQPRRLLCFVLFASAALILLTYPLDEPIEILLHGLPGAMFPHLAAGFVAWFACLACLAGLMAQARAAEIRNHDLLFAIDNYLYLGFLLFFAAERLFGSAVPRSQWPGSELEPQWIQMLSAICVCLCIALVLPRLRGIREGFSASGQDQDRFLNAAENSLYDFYIFDGVPDNSGRIVDFRFRYINPNAERRLRTRREELIGKILTEVRPFMISSGLIEKYREVVLTGEPYTCEVFLDDERIQATWLNVEVVKLGDGIAITSRDVTERKRVTEHVYRLAHYDQLTGLPNRTLLRDRLQQAILHAHRYKQKVAVFMLDIDHFKRINDSLGHADGDALLTAVGSRLLSSVRQTDTIARIGGDEFVIVMPEFENLEDVRHCGLQILHRAAQPIVLGKRELKITLSIGICIYPECGSNADQLLKNADTAMYSVKDRGRNGLHIFREDML